MYNSSSVVQLTGEERPNHRNNDNGNDEAEVTKGTPTFT